MTKKITAHSIKILYFKRKLGNLMRYEFIKELISKGVLITQKGKNSSK